MPMLRGWLRRNFAFCIWQYFNKEIDDDDDDDDDV